MKAELACISDLVSLDVLKEELQELPIYFKVNSKEVAIPIKKDKEIQYPVIFCIMSGKDIRKL